MKVKIKMDDNEKEFELKINGKIVNNVWKALKKLQDGIESVDAVLEYKGFIDSQACLLTGLTIDELDELDIDERNKLTGAIVEKTKESLNFTSPSLK